MTPEAKLRMEVYQEGQRSWRDETTCPYTDWRAGTWAKGRAAAKAHYEAQVAAERHKPPPQEMKSAGWTIRRRPWSGSIAIESPEGDGTDLYPRDTDVFDYFDTLLKENGL
jgi:hypothetical protein